MDLNVDLSEAAMRLGAALVAGFVIGLDREDRGRPAGLRTTVLVCLAAAGSMVLANLLLGTAGKQWDSFGAMDIMRLPLGVLTGMGFIGAGAILHRGNLVIGVTTAATLWFTTIMGFCFGAGEMGLGFGLLGLAMLVLWGFRWVEKVCKERHEATLVIGTSSDSPTEKELRELLHHHDYRVVRHSAEYSPEGRELRFEIWRRAQEAPPETPKFIQELAARPEIRQLVWTPH